ncbi:uncharacterized protein LOC123505084 [Portunus trituberculatus]|uniref:uncharacterized protein LOC123505084 n=1 Tax=Portunus trituberculatus TaxID=210409 RepID=UPI001E1CCDD9|nr:uncharacterized protein LOC123505084 [Portunus trituberculatus]
MLPSSLVFIGVVLVIPIVSPDCRVTPSSRLDVKNQQLTIRFWGFITGIEVHSFLTVVLYDKDLPLLKIECNHTHVTIHASEFKAEKTSEPVPWPVCSEWRQFRLVIHSNHLDITDDHNNTWVSRSIRKSPTCLKLVMDHLEPSCSTPTPMWEVGANTQDIAAPRCHDALHFTLQADTIVTPRLTVGNVSLTLHELSLSQPSLSLTVRGTPGATPAVLVAVVCGMTVEVGCTVPTLSLSSENGATFTVTQRIHLQECPPKTHKTKKAQSGGGSQDCAQVYRLSLFLATVLVVLLITLCVSCLLHLKKRQTRLHCEQTPRVRTQRKGMQKHHITESPTKPRKESPLYLEPRPAPGVLHPTHITLQPWMPPSAHIYENSDHSSTDNYDDFELDIYNGK